MLKIIKIILKKHLLNDNSIINQKEFVNYNIVK